MIVVAVHVWGEIVVYSTRLKDVKVLKQEFYPSIRAVSCCISPYSLADHNRPFRANSIFRLASPSLKPPLDTQAMLPSPNSTLSSTFGNAHGQWCGK